MKSDKKILFAFILNLLFSIFELVGGIFTASIAIISDSVHDFGDALSIGTSYFLEKKSKNKPDNKYTYGYLRFSVLGSVITTCILIIGSFIVVYSAIQRIINPVQINYDGMIIFGVVGVIVNFVAALLTHGGDSLNQKAVNLHMLEDVLGWVVVLIGAVVMKFTDFSIIDTILSIGVAIFILINSFKNLKYVIDIFLLKTPKNLDVEELKHHLLEIDGVLDVHHIHLWTLDGNNVYATLHVVYDEKVSGIKEKVREELKEHHIHHVTIELEKEDECCNEKSCVIHECNHVHDHHHHHHHH